jgi:mono/diheme cytochrome c family protein
MPAWGHTLTKSQIDDVIVYVRAFATPTAAK